ncbi:GNAT family N-acetyltransferase [Metabacillus niabensis]|uniref:Ribosomal protein S18 acetylase RimI-like enzyme n=1 Tax=Metabacillus niabensis TaxID=324854 RepID=A0ABT9Z1G4_9BACI|nr:GNAT family N-acetyltransferase [Metabacillus niabensis]MDQ0225814.1 ribosomal protein S18 acetylase RimI-like enzyme [Metabacillus niabensis]
MNIRLLVSEDQDEVKKLMEDHPLQFPSFIIDKYPQRWSNFLKLKSNRKSNGYYVAYTEANQIIGHAGYRYDEVTGLYEIVGVVVKRDFKRKGIGKALIETICMQVEKLGERKVILYTLGHRENEATIIFYKHIGFQLVKYEKDFFIPGFHRVTFVRTMNEEVRKR